MSHLAVRCDLAELDLDGDHRVGLVLAAGRARPMPGLALPGPAAKGQAFCSSDAAARATAAGPIGAHAIDRDHRSGLLMPSRRVLSVCVRSGKGLAPADAACLRQPRRSPYPKGVTQHGAVAHSRRLHARRHQQGRLLRCRRSAERHAGARPHPAARHRQPRPLRQAHRRHGRSDVQHQQGRDPVRVGDTRLRRRFCLRSGGDRRPDHRLVGQLRQPQRGGGSFRHQFPGSSRRPPTA